MRYLQSLMDHYGCLIVTGNVSDVGNVSSLRKTMARVRDNCRCRQSWSMSPPSPFRNFAKNPQFCTFVSPSILRSSISHLLYTNTHHQMGQQEEPVVDTCSPRRQAILMGHARTRVVRKVSVFCFCVILCGILCCPILFVILIVIKFILFY